jgi:hypothetical protein
MSAEQQGHALPSSRHALLSGAMLSSRTVRRVQAVARALSPRSDQSIGSSTHLQIAYEVLESDTPENGVVLIQKCTEELSRWLQMRHSDTDASVVTPSAVRAQCLQLIPLLEKASLCDARGCRAAKLALYRLIGITWSEDGEYSSALPWFSYCTQVSSGTEDYFYHASTLAHLGREQDALHMMELCEEAHAILHFRSRPSLWHHLFGFAKACATAALRGTAQRYLSRVQEARRILDEQKPTSNNNPSVDVPSAEELELLQDELS